MIPEVIPEQLRNSRSWVVWRYELHDGRSTKVPYSAIRGSKASSANPNTWTTFEAAEQAAQHYSGVGFVFQDTGNTSRHLLGVDLDHCFNTDGQLKNWARDIVALFASTYAERSPSGCGLHIFTVASLPKSYRHKFYVDGDEDGGAIEIYHSGRYFTVTGERFEDHPSSLDECQSAVDHLLSLKPNTRVDSGAKAGIQHKEAVQPVLSDGEVLQIAGKAKNAAKFNKLWRGDISGYRSASEADFALLSLLGFYCGDDREQIARLFRQSALGRRDKADRDDYINRSIDHILASPMDCYQPRSHGTGVDVTRAQNSSELLTLLNCLSIWGGKVRWAAFKRRGAFIIGRDVEGHVVRWSSTSELLSFSKSQAAIAAGTYQVISKPARNQITTSWQQAATLILKLAAEDAEVCVGDESDVLDLLAYAFKSANSPQPSSDLELYLILKTLHQYRRDPKADPAPACVFMWQGHVWVHLPTLRLWLSTPRGANRLYGAGEMKQALQLGEFTYNPAIERTHDGARISIGLWCGPVDSIGVVS